MTLSNLLKNTAARYEIVVRQVLDGWEPECGCDRPGSKPHCEACPCLGVFEQLVQEKIAVLAKTHQTVDLH